MLISAFLVSNYVECYSLIMLYLCPKKLILRKLAYSLSFVSFDTLSVSKTWRHLNSRSRGIEIYPQTALYYWEV